MAERGLTGRVLTAWADMGGSLRWLLARRPSETTLFVFLLISGLMLLLLVIAERVLNPAAGPIEAGGASGLGGLVGAGLVVFGLLWPLLLYLLALLGHGLARAFGGTGSGHASRAAMAWAALVAAPVAVVASVAGLFAAPLLPAAAAGALRSLGLLAFAYALAHCFAAAHGFARPWAALAIVAALVLGIAALPRLLA